MVSASTVRLGRMTSGSVRSNFLRQGVLAQKLDVEDGAVNHAFLKGVRRFVGTRAAVEVAANLGKHDSVDQLGLGGKAAIKAGPANAAAAGDVFHRDAADTEKLELFQGPSQNPCRHLVGVEYPLEHGWVGLG